MFDSNVGGADQLTLLNTLRANMIQTNIIKAKLRNGVGIVRTLNHFLYWQNIGYVNPYTGFHSVSYRNTELLSIRQRTVESKTLTLSLRAGEKRT
ncbi:uncharacterized protein METZ01_LOCUS247956 [marine metagenome]|uniref:Uncharacterized protein n=1 Tax=marine metagenome TaxID=408172 RepID=A0A382I6Z2_9ZZZZ